MSIVLYLLVLTESMLPIILFLPFGVLAYVETVRGEPWRAYRVQTEKDLRSAKMTRWHIVAAIFAIASVFIIPFRTIFGSVNSDGLLAETGLPLVVDLTLIEVSLWLVTLSAVFGPMYAVRLHSRGVTGADMIGLGLCLFPATLMAVSVLELGSGPASNVALGIVGLVLFPLGIVMPGRRVKMAVLVSACVVMLIALSDFASPANPVWLLAAIAMGYTVFRAESKRAILEHLVKAYAAGRSVLTLPKRPKWITSKLRTVVFLVVNVACVLALLLAWWLLGTATNDSLPAAMFAIAAMLIAAVGALLTALVPMAFGHSRSEIDHVATTFVVVLAAASVMHLTAAPRVEGWVYGDSLSAQYWKPVLGFFAVGGALAIAYATLSGRLLQIRPLMIAIVLPAVSLLPSESFFSFRPEDALSLWTLRLVETGTIVVILVIMWYVFGPGRLRDSDRSGSVSTQPSALASSP